MPKFFRTLVAFIAAFFLLFFMSNSAQAADCVNADAVATTYKTVLNPEYVPAVEEESHVVTVVDEEAYDEDVLVTAEQTIKHEAIPPTTTSFPPVFVPAVTHTVHHEAVTHTVFHPAVTHEVYHEAVWHVEYKFVQWITGNVKWKDTPYWNSGPGNDFGWFYAGITRDVVDVDCWTETVVDSEAWTETVVDVAAYDEVVIDVEAYTIPGYEVLNEDGVDAWTEVIPAVYTTVHHDAVTHEETVIDVEAADAIGEETISVVDVQGTDAIVCPVVAVVNTVDPSPSASPAAVVAQAPANNSELDSRDGLAQTGGAWERVAPYALGFLVLGLVLLMVAFQGRRYDRKTSFKH